MRLRTRSTSTNARRATAGVELALLLPFLLFLWVVAVDWSRIFYYVITIQYASRDGAYYASNYPGIYDYSNPEDAAVGELSSFGTSPPTVSGYYTAGSDPTNASWTSFDPSGGSNVPSSATYVKISVTYTFTTVTNWPGVPSSTTLTRYTIMQAAPIVPGGSGGNV